MKSGILIDTGPIVSILSRGDTHHKICAEQLRTLRPPLYTCWPVLTEAAWLLRQHPKGVDRLMESFSNGLFQLVDVEARGLDWIAEFLQRYRRVGAQLADATLVYLAEQRGIETVFTLDRRDFLVYRLSRNRALKLLPEL